MSTETVPDTPATEPKFSPVEAFKENSRWLRGTIAEELADPALDHLSEPNKQLIKFHGSYQQEDRDARKKRDKPGVGKAYMFMVRLKLPGSTASPSDKDSVTSAPKPRAGSQGSPGLVGPSLREVFGRAMWTESRARAFPHSQ